MSSICVRFWCHPVTIISRVRLGCVAMKFKMLKQHMDPFMLNSSTNVRTKSSITRICGQTLSSNTASPTYSEKVLFPTCFRCKTTSAKHQTELENMDKKEFMELYFIKNISFLRVLCRFSKLSVLLFLFAAPASLMSTQLGVISMATGTKAVLTFAAYSVLFTTQSFLFSSRVVGKIMMSTDEEVVKLSHLSIFGDRRDVFFKPSDILPQKKERGGGYLAENLCHFRIKGYSKNLFYLPHQGHDDTDHERIELLLSGEFSKRTGI